MDKLKDYAIVEGQIAEVLAKANLLQNRLQNDPNLADLISDDITKLEIEMMDYLRNLMELSDADERSCTTASDEGQGNSCR